KIAAVLVGTALGLLATWFTVVRVAVPGGVTNGPWRTDLAVADSRGNPYTRAKGALHGVLALNRRETTYYTATTDGDGHRLDGRCRYAISGRDPDARWWSITAYGPDEFLIPNAANRYSVSKTTVAREPGGDFLVQVGGANSGANWIPLAQRYFSLSLRLYNPGLADVLDPAHVALPTLRKVGCPLKSALESLSCGLLGPSQLRRSSTSRRSTRCRVWSWGKRLRKWVSRTKCTSEVGPRPHRTPSSVRAPTCSMPAVLSICRGDPCGLSRGCRTRPIGRSQ